MLKQSLYLLLFGLIINCNSPVESSLLFTNNKELTFYSPHKGALLSTRFNSMQDFEKEVTIKYSGSGKSAKVRLVHNSHGNVVVSELTSGYSDNEIRKAQHEGFWKKVKVVLSEPMLLYYGEDLRKIWSMVRRRQYIFGADDVVIFDFAERMVENIYEHDRATMNEKELSEKGYLNSFNHINGQAIMTSLFSENFADYIADVHERGNMPELVTGKFTKEQIEDLEFGPVDNYIDIINNEWGQELGKELALKYDISRTTIWTPQLLTDYLNALQAYYSWAFQIGFKPFLDEDPIVQKFAKKLNIIMSGVSLK